MTETKKHCRIERPIKAQSDTAPATRSETERLAQLDLEFRISSILYEAADGGRLGAQFALAATIEYLSEKGFVEGRLDPLESVFGALMDADRGARHPMLIPRTVKHRPPSSTDQGMPKVIAAVALDLLIKSGTLSKLRAAQTVANAVRGWELSISKDVTRATVGNWREHISSSPYDDFFAQRYRRLVDRFTQNFSGPDLATAAHRLLRKGLPLAPKI